jgi:broad specificity phosphatase PhoE
MKIILVRHAESEHNAGIKKGEDAKLTKKGIQQAMKLGKRLKKQEISKIYTSNLNRAKKTADIISKEINVSIKRIFSELNEYSGVQVKSKIKLLFNKRLKRLKKLLRTISKDKNKKESLLIVAHGVTNRIIMGYLLGFSIKRNLLFFQQKNTCVNILHWDNKWKNWRVDLWNDVSHLPKKLSS